MPSNIDYAKYYLNLGFKIFPIIHRSKTPACPHGHLDAVDNYEEARVWWDDGSNKNNGIAVFCKPSNIVVVDVDPRNYGFETLEELLKDNGPLPETLTHSTGGGGIHYFFKLDPKWKCVGSIGAGIDIKHNGYVILPPSIHESGEPYTQKVNVNIAELPGWLAAKIIKGNAPDQPQFDTNSTMTSCKIPVYVQAAIDKSVAELLACGEGERNKKLNVLAYSLYRYSAAGEVDEYEITRALGNAALNVGLKRAEVEKTLQSAKEAAKTAPKQVPEGTRKHYSIDDALAAFAPNNEVVDPETGEVTAAPSWVDLLARNSQNGKLRPTPCNAQLILTNSVATGQCLAFNTRTGDYHWRRMPEGIEGLNGEPRPIKDTDAVFLAGWLERKTDQTWPITIVQSAITACAEQNSYNDLEIYLNGLVWDQTCRIGHWTVDLLGAADTVANKIMGRKWLIQCVARALNPGCQADQMLVLEGKQGIGKSSAVRALGGDWYQANLSNVDSPNAIHDIQRSWIVEVGELDSLRGAASTKIKDFITRTSDTYRQPYARFSKTSLRRCVFVATTNEGVYLDDATGARRFWPIECKNIDVKTISEMRDQLWAEAVAKYKEGENWWIKDENIDAGIAENRESRRIIDP